MASTEVAEYLDDNGETVGKDSGVKPPEGYNLLSSKSPTSPKKEPKPLKEIKAKASSLKPVLPPKGYVLQATPKAPDFTSNPNSEGLYRMFKPSASFGEGENIQVPYSKVQQYLSAGGQFDPTTGEATRYQGDKANEGKKPSLFTRARTASEDSSRDGVTA